MGAIIVVAISILAAVTLLPGADERCSGRRAYARGRIAILFGLFVRIGSHAPAPAPAPRRATPRRGFWERWTDGGHRAARGSRRWPARRVLLALAIPALSLAVRQRRAAPVPRRTTRRASAPSSPRRRPGPGATGPVQAIAELRQRTRERPRQPRGARLLRRRLRSRSGGRARRAPAAVARRSRRAHHRRSRGTTRRAPRPRRSSTRLRAGPRAAARRGRRAGGRRHRVQLGLRRPRLGLDVEDPAVRARRSATWCCCCCCARCCCR